MKTTIEMWLVVDFNSEKSYLKFTENQYVIRDIN